MPCDLSPVLLAKTDSHLMYCLQHYWGRIILSSEWINTQMIYRFALNQVECASYFYYAIV